MTVQDTTLESYILLKKSGKLGKMEKEVYSAIKRWPDKTDTELATLLDYSDPNKVRPRRRNLVQKGLVKAYNSRVCMNTGRRCYTWRIR